VAEDSVLLGEVDAPPRSRHPPGGIHLRLGRAVVIFLSVATLTPACAPTEEARVGSRASLSFGPHLVRREPAGCSRGSVGGLH
jgi:hypothetical protein